MEEINVNLTLQERSCLRNLLLLRTGKLTEAIAKAERLEKPAIAGKCKNERDTLTEILSKL